MVIRTRNIKFPYKTSIKKADRLLHEADHKWRLITEKHTEILDFIPCVMVLLLHSNRQMDGHTVPKYVLQIHVQLCTNKSILNNLSLIPGYLVQCF